MPRAERKIWIDGVECSVSQRSNGKWAIWGPDLHGRICVTGEVSIPRGVWSGGVYRSLGHEFTVNGHIYKAKGGKDVLQSV